jgi:hypothetical protein
LLGLKPLQELLVVHVKEPSEKNSNRAIENGIEESEKPQEIHVGWIQFCQERSWTEQQESRSRQARGRAEGERVNAGKQTHDGKHYAGVNRSSSHRGT